MLLDEAISWVLGLLGATVALLVVAVILLWRVGNLLKPVRSQKSPSSAKPDPELAERKQTTREQKQLFSKFLEEDPARAELPKREQFEAFRRWRQEKGYNWSA